jgi:soluble lytic murein transglycosylase-like protein
MELTVARPIGMFAHMPQPKRISATLAPLVLAMCLTLLGAAPEHATAETVYAFLDGNGVTHFSNAPTDPRYKKLRATSGGIDRFRPTSTGISTKAVHQAIKQSSERHSLDPALVRAVIRAESAFNSNAVSRKGAIGLMQLMPDTASSLNVTNPYDPEQNIAGGARYLRYLLDRFHGNVPLALAAYNAGETRVRDSRIPRIPETREYIRRVLRFYDDFSREDARKQAVKTVAFITPLPGRWPSRSN